MFDSTQAQLNRGTLARIRSERPVTFAGIKAALDIYSAQSNGDAFYSHREGASDGLDDALRDAGWKITDQEGDYMWTATHPLSGACVRYLGGDVYCLEEGSVLL